MKCNECGADATAICKFCGRAVCDEHTQEMAYPSGYPRRAFGRRNNAVRIENAVWCGRCDVSTGVSE